MRRNHRAEEEGEAHLDSTTFDFTLISALNVTSSITLGSQMRVK